MSTLWVKTHRQGGNYERKLQVLADAGKLPEHGLHRAEARHDNWCAFLTGGQCNCDPDIYLDGKLVR